MRKHVDAAIGEVDGGGPRLGLSIEEGTFGEEGIGIGNVNTNAEQTWKEMRRPKKREKKSRRGIPAKRAEKGGKAGRGEETRTIGELLDGESIVDIFRALGIDGVDAHGAKVAAPSELLCVEGRGGVPGGDGGEHLRGELGAADLMLDKESLRESEWRKNKGKSKEEPRFQRREFRSPRESERSGRQDRRNQPPIHRPSRRTACSKRD